MERRLCKNACVCVYLCICVCACMRACVRVCAIMPACTYYHTVLSANKWLSERGYVVLIKSSILYCTSSMNLMS